MMTCTSKPMPDAKGLCTKAIQDHIDAVAAQGGGLVSIGPGTYKCASLHLRSNITLHLEKGAIILGSENLDDYEDIAPQATNKDQSCKHLIIAEGCENLTITGEGIIDGNDQAFWNPCIRKEDRPYGIFRYTVKDNPRNRPSPLVQLVKCTNLHIEGITVRNMPGWGLHIFRCAEVEVKGITVLGDPYGPNTDGIGINSSKNVLVEDCYVDTGDDCVILKTTEEDVCCENVHVRNCTLASNCSAVGLGAESTGSIQNILMEDCTVTKALRMIQIEMWTSGTISNVTFRRIKGKTFPDDEVYNERPIYIDIQEFIRKGGELGHAEHILFEDIECESRGRIMFTAQDGSKIEHVQLKNVTITVPEIEDPAVRIPEATSMQLSNFNPETRAQRAAVIIDNVHDILLDNVVYHWPEASEIPMHAMCIRQSSEIKDQSPELQANQAKLPRINNV